MDYTINLYQQHFLYYFLCVTVWSVEFFFYENNVIEITMKFDDFVANEKI